MNVDVWEFIALFLQVRNSYTKFKLFKKPTYGGTEVS